MKVLIQPTEIGGALHAPSSKSAMQRACALALLHEGETIIVNPGNSADDLAALQVIRKLGAKVIVNEVHGEEQSNIMVSSPGLSTVSSFREFTREINCGESGLCVRMFTPIAAILPAEIIINGEGSLLSRPMNLFDQVFPELETGIQSNNGKLPIKIKGPLVAKDITIDGTLSSQFLTGLLMAFAGAARQKVTINVMGLKSKPYIDLTLEMMRHFGYQIANENYERFHIIPKTGNGDLNPVITYTVEGDWSSAAFLLTAGAIAGGIKLKGLNLFSVQADKAILQVLRDAEADLEINSNEIVVRLKKLKPFRFNATDCPDLFPPLVSLAAYCEGTSVIEGVHRLIFKESNRAYTLIEEFKKMGIKVELMDDRLVVEGGKIKGANVHSHHDHRIAMACAVAALRAEGETLIEEAGAVNKSYPDFYKHLKMLGANVSLLSK